MDILLIQSQKNGLTTSLFIEDFSIINHWSNHPLIVQDGSAKDESVNYPPSKCSRFGKPFS
jgi:hypothetical protein